MDKLDEMIIAFANSKERSFRFRFKKYILGIFGKSPNFLKITFATGKSIILARRKGVRISGSGREYS